MSTIKVKRLREVRWTQELTSLLIYLWEQNEHLYNSRHEDHISKVKRAESLEKICEELQKLNSHVSVEGIRKKIHSLCTLYAAEYKNWRINDYYVPKLWCFEQLNFLTRGIAPRSSKSNIDSIDLNDNSCSNEDVSRSSEKTALSDKSKSILKKKKPSLDNIKQVLILKEFFNKKLSNRYEWLGQQVHFRINSIKNESILKETIEGIENILNDCASRDKSANQLNNAGNKNFLLTNKFPVKHKKNKPLDPGVNEIQQKILSLNDIINENIITTHGGLCKKVINMVSVMQDEDIREETSWAIQCTLKESVERDKLLSQHINAVPQESNTEVVDSTNMQNIESFISSIWDDVNLDVEV